MKRLVLQDFGEALQKIHHIYFLKNFHLHRKHQRNQHPCGFIDV